ncbi:hypothetical protein LCGC14_1809380 [marine sediment metagenome]|uniref:Uncharacterized protein n=1 Tax=marine sediment metagenome TaxID=412755 RepID=A0A0F9GM30_9ZZZZ
MSVKSFREAQKAISNIVQKARIPVISMIAILETEKFQLLSRVDKTADEKDAKKFFAELQAVADERAENAGVH